MLQDGRYQYIKKTYPINPKPILFHTIYDAHINQYHNKKLSHVYQHYYQNDHYDNVILHHVLRCVIIAYQRPKPRWKYGSVPLRALSQPQRNMLNIATNMLPCLSDNVTGEATV